MNNTASFGRGGRIRNTVDITNIKSGSTLTFQDPSSVEVHQDTYDNEIQPTDPTLPSTFDSNNNSNELGTIVIEDSEYDNDDFNSANGEDMEVEEGGRFIDECDLFSINEKDDELGGDGVVLDEFDDDLCMALEIRKKSKRNQAFDSVDYSIFVNKIGIDAIVLSNDEIVPENLSRAIPVVRDINTGIGRPKYVLKSGKAAKSVPLVLSLSNFIEFKAGVTLNGNNFLVFRRDETTGSYKFFKIKKDENDADLQLADMFKDGDRIFEVDSEVFGMKFGALIDKNLNIHLSFFSKDIEISSSRIWDGIKNATCYISNKIFSIFKKKKKELKFGEKDIKYVINKNKLYYLY